MNNIAIPGVTKSEVEGTAGEAGLKPFPFVTGRWINHTAEVTAIELFEGDKTDYLIIKGKNNEYGVRISVQLDPTFIANDFGQDTAKQVARNKDKLLKVLAAFNLAIYKGNDVLLAPIRFSTAIGKVFAFSIQGVGKANERGYEMYNISFKGTVTDLLPVVVPEGAGSDVPFYSGAGNGNGQVADDTDITF